MNSIVLENREKNENKRKKILELFFVFLTWFSVEEMAVAVVVVVVVEGIVLSIPVTAVSYSPSMELCDDAEAVPVLDSRFSYSRKFVKKHLISVTPIRLTAKTALCAKKWLFLLRSILSAKNPHGFQIKPIDESLFIISDLNLRFEDSILLV